MGLAQSAEADAAELDLHIDIELDEAAVQPEYATPGKGAFTIFAPRDIDLVPEQWTLVPTGLYFRLPFMLVIVVDAPFHDVMVQRTIVDCDYNRELVLQVQYRGGQEPTHTVRRGEPLASAMVLPVARPGFRFYYAEVERV